MNERQFKRAVAILLSLCMCLSCLPAAVFAEEGEKETQNGQKSLIHLLLLSKRNGTAGQVNPPEQTEGSDPPVL